jgi:regulatory protein
MLGGQSLMKLLESEKDVWNKAIGLLARREYSRLELRNKLKPLSEGVDAEQVLERLSESGYQSDERFADSFVRMRVGQGHGLNRIRFDLKAKGIKSDMLEAILEQNELDWFALAAELYQRKYAFSKQNLDYKERAKRVRFMSQRGFSFDEIRYAEDEFESEVR